MMNNQSPKPNVIWIFGDQHRAQALSINGDQNVNTPNIDRLAKEGVNFPSAVSGFPLCCPFRGALLTSKYPHKCVVGHEYLMEPGQKTVAHVLNENGYKTAYFGKWHLDGFHEENGRAAMHIVPPERRGGFETWIGYENNNSQWDSWVHGGEEKDAFHYRLPGYETDELTNLLIKYLRERSEDNEKAETDRPFFAVLSVQPPHDPYVAPPSFMEKYNPQSLKMRPNVPMVERVQKKARRDLAGAYAMIDNLDHNVGRIRDELQRLNLADNTHIIFFSDHGDMHGSHGQFAKLTAYEESIRVPFIISGEHSCEYDNRMSGESPALINHVDIAPTTLGLCGIEKPDWMMGTDYSYCRIKKDSPSDSITSAFIQSVVPTGHGNSVDKSWRGIVTIDGWKYVCFEKTTWLMFNLNEDPYELVNLAHNPAFKKKRTELNDELAMWIEKTADRFLLPLRS